MTQITVDETFGPPKDWEPPRPEKSTILFQLIEGESYLLERWDNEKKANVPIGLDFHEVQYEGGSAEIEACDGMLEYVLGQMLEPDEIAVGWFVMEGFYGSYSRDYYGEVDCDHECDDVRPARWSDMEQMGLCRAPWYAKLARMVGVDLKVPPRTMYPNG